jgi:phage terminase large subunit-like protein
VAFKFNAKQAEAQLVCSSAAKHVMLEGGSRSGKTFLHVRNIVMRAMKAPGSRHAILRFRFNHVKQSIVMDTFPKVMALCYPDVAYNLNKTDWFVTLPNKAEIWFGGLDDKERTEKILGLEFVTVYLNECSQISWAAVQMILTRLAQLIMQVVQGLPDTPLKPRVYYDCNPPDKGHWTFKVFHQKLDPETKEPLKNPEDYAYFKINPRDNQENLSADYMSTLASLSERNRRRFERGEYGDSTPGALFAEALIDRWRVMDGNLPDFVRVVVGVDPSGSGDTDNAHNDEIGIVIGALGTDGNGYLLEDCTIKAGPATWGKVSTDAFERHDADVIVGETNFGGDMVRATIQTTRKNTPFKKVTASRGKIARAEPFSALYEQGKVRHVGIMAKLEDELCGFTTNGYLGAGSPNRADAAIWVLAELFPAIVAGPKTEKPKRERVHRGGGAWMG